MRKDNERECETIFCFGASQIFDRFYYRMNEIRVLLFHPQTEDNHHQ